MALDPDILFFDEPSAGLDPIRSRRLDELILAVRDSLGATVVVTHELSRRMGDALRFPLLPPVWRKIVGVVVFSRGQFLSEKRLFVLFLEGSVKGLNIGAPVDFQGVQIGSVTDIRLHYIAEDHEFRTPVFIELEPARITEVGVRDAAVDAEIKEHGLCKTSIDRGLRAQLATQSLVIGQLFVQMVFHPDTPVRLVGGESKVPELPTIPTTLQQASQEAQELLKKLGELPLDQLFANVLGITQGLNRLVNAPETQALVHVLSRTTTDVQELVRHLQGGPQLAGGHPAVGKEEEGVMQRKTIALFMGGALVVFSATIALSAEQAHWGYSGNVGPEHWGTLAPAYELCARGRNQSPLDLTGFVRADLQPIKVRYRTTAQEIHNTGHSLQANYTPGSTIELDGHVFELKQFHFHAPSENRISSKIFPLEGHLVHADSGGNLAVVAVMFVEGKANTTVAALWKQMPTKEGEKVALTSQVNAAGLLPKNRAYYRYNGSLTTPPCSEGVWWLVLKEPVSVSRQQVEAFTTVMGHPNNRPVQALNARPILQPRSK